MANVNIWTKRNESSSKLHKKGLHNLCREEKRYEYGILVGKPEAKGALGRPSRR
jgi:hypothetical protein